MPLRASHCHRRSLMRAAARALRISHSNMLTSPGRVASAGHWCPSAVMHYAFIRRASFSVTAPTYAADRSVAHARDSGYAAVLRARQCRRGPDRSLHLRRVTRIWHDFWSSLLIAVAARRIAKKGQDAPDRDRPQLKQEIHSAASARCLNGNPNRCQTSTKASASVSIKPSS